MSEPDAYTLTRESAEFFARFRDTGIAEQTPDRRFRGRAFAWLEIEDNSPGVSSNVRQARIVRWDANGVYYDLSPSNGAYLICPFNGGFGPQYGNSGTNYPNVYFAELVGYKSSGGGAGLPCFMPVEKTISNMSVGTNGSGNIEEGTSPRTGELLWYDSTISQWVRLAPGSVGQVLVMCQESGGGVIRPAWLTPPASFSGTSITAPTRVTPPALPAGASWPAESAGPEPAPTSDSPSAGASSPTDDPPITSPAPPSWIWPPTFGSVQVTVVNGSGVPQVGRYLTCGGVYYQTNADGTFEFGALTAGSTASVLLTTLGGGETSAWSTDDAAAGGSSPTGTGFTATAKIAAAIASTIKFVVS